MADLKVAGIIFDFDDTLVYSHEHFLLAEKAFAKRMAELGLADEDLLPAARQHDIANVRQAGYLAVECFPLALVQTYEGYCGKYGRAADESEKRLLMELGRQPYLTQPRAVEGAQELLEYLRCTEEYNWLLILFTQGEQEIQQQRLNLCSMASMFDVIEIVRKKDDAMLQTLLLKQHLDPALSWYVGNSMRSDINPAIRAGLNAVHLTIDGWGYEDEEPCGFYHSISHLGQFTTLLQRSEAER